MDNKRDEFQKRFNRNQKFMEIMMAVIFILAALFMVKTLVFGAYVNECANVRDSNGNIVAVAYEGDEITIMDNCWWDSSRTEIYLDNQYIYGSILTECIGYGNYYQMEPSYNNYVNYDNYSNYYTVCWVDVNLSEQKVRVYAGNQCLLAADCVSGMYCVSDTPCGTFYILNKESPAILSGENYETQVDFWMPFTWNGCGLHDATWQSYFGDNVYMWNGSHGCVNLSWWNAMLVYNLVDVGSMVYVHY